MRKHAPLRIVAAGLVLASAVSLTDDPLFVSSGKPQSRAARRVKKYDSLTGLWIGAYRYANDGFAVPFNARLEESAGSFTGEIDEPNTFADPSAARLFATVRGAREGMNVSFIKRYNGAAGSSHAVGYTGVVNSDFTRIEGQWSLPQLSGTFFMERAEAGAEAAASQAASATA